MADKKTVVCDTECYRDFWLAAFKSTENDKTLTFAAWPGHPLDVDGLARIMRNVTIVTFNGIGYDAPMIAYALTGVSCSDLKDASDAIIQDRLKPWDFERRFQVQVPRNWDHIDLMEVAPGQGSLKAYGGRLHCHRMQDLPIEPDASISPDDRELLTLYCLNDLETTIQLYKYLQPQLALRVAMSEEYGRDLRSKSDPQIAEAVVKDRVSDLVGWRVERPKISFDTTFKYTAPPMVSFQTPELQAVKTLVEEQTFTLSDSGKVLMPKDLAKADIKIGDSVYRMGIGGLHSSEACAAHFTDEDHFLEDRDVASYYPSMILLNGWAPEHLGESFITVYRQIYERRLAAKARAKVIRTRISEIEAELVDG